MLTPDELDQLRRDLIDLIEDRTAEMVDAGQDDERAWLTAALEVDAGLRKAALVVSTALDERARRAGMSYAAIGAARGTSKQAAHRRVSAR